MNTLRPYERMDKYGQFLTHDREVLSFRGYWDDSDSLFGDVHEMILNYFLADDTIEVREIVKANSGRDAIPMFCKREKLPKDGHNGSVLPGVKTPRTVLNVCRTHHLLDARKTGAAAEVFI